MSEFPMNAIEAAVDLSAAIERQRIVALIEATISCSAGECDECDKQRDLIARIKESQS